MILRLQTVRARSLRRNGTKVEQRLWRALREAGLPWRFRRQHPNGGRIVDRACPARKLAIELDGGQHAQRRKADAVRSAAIEAHGYRVVRFWNSEVLENLGGVLQSIRAAVENPPPHPALSAPGGGEGDRRPDPLPGSHKSRETFVESRSAPEGGEGDRRSEPDTSLTE